MKCDTHDEKKSAKKKAAKKKAPKPKHYAENADVSGVLRALGMDAMGRYGKRK
jgi:hypothetical protein